MIPVTKIKRQRLRKSVEWKQELDALMREYDQAVAELQRKRKPLDGVLGLGSHPGEAACHEILDGKIQELCQRAETEAETVGLQQRA